LKIFKKINLCRPITFYKFFFSRKIFLSGNGPLKQDWKKCLMFLGSWICLFKCSSTVRNKNNGKFDRTLYQIWTLNDTSQSQMTDKEVWYHDSLCEKFKMFLSLHGKCSRISRSSSDKITDFLTGAQLFSEIPQVDGASDDLWYKSSHKLQTYKLWDITVFFQHISHESSSLRPKRVVCKVQWHNTCVRLKWRFKIFLLLHSLLPIREAELT
jgi:hypothetical protein